MRLPDGRPPRRSGDGWTYGSDGKKHWGLNGAAGLMLVDPDRGVLMQHRALWSVEGGTWGFPGGARDMGESAVDAAVRESWEEAGVPDQDGSGIKILETHVLDLDTWSYTTVIAKTLRRFDAVINDPRASNCRGCHSMSSTTTNSIRESPRHCRRCWSCCAPTCEPGGESVPAGVVRRPSSDSTLSSILDVQLVQLYELRRSPMRERVTSVSDPVWANTRFRRW